MEDVWYRCLPKVPGVSRRHGAYVLRTQKVVTPRRPVGRRARGRPTSRESRLEALSPEEGVRTVLLERPTVLFVLVGVCRRPVRKGRSRITVLGVPTPFSLE